jgi:D-arabinose 1-dehydrogenase-like Zn-dependent alcohol dehydrogenase
MDTNSTVYPLTVTFEHPQIPILSMNIQGISIQGSFVASRQTIRELLEFASRKNIKPIIEKFPLSTDGIEQAMQKLRDGDIRYRAVLVRGLNG